MKRQKVLISERALIQRVNRKLKAEHRQVKATRGFWDNEHLHHYEDNNLGRFYVLNTHRNFVDDHHVNLTDLARKLGAMADWEELAPTA